MLGDSNLVCSRDRSRALVARTGVPLADAYLEFLGGRCRPNTARSARWPSRRVVVGVTGGAHEHADVAAAVGWHDASRSV